MEASTCCRAPKSASNFAPTVAANENGMNDRIKRLRKESFEAEPSLSIERALIETAFYKENYGKYPIPVLRAMNFYEICKNRDRGFQSCLLFWKCRTKSLMPQCDHNSFFHIRTLVLS